MTISRTSQLGAETFRTGETNSRTSQVGAEVFRSGETNSRTSQLGVETFIPLTSPSRTSQLGVELFIPPEGVRVYVDGVEVEAQLPTFEIRETANGISTMVCDVLSLGSPAFEPALHTPVRVVEDGVTIFAGTLTQVRVAGIGGAPNLYDDDTGASQIVVSLTAEDYSRIPERRYVTETFSASASPAITLKDVLETFVADYLTDYGVTLHPAQVDGPVVGELSFERVRLSEALNALANAHGFVWRIDYDKQLRMWQVGDLTAPFDIDEDDAPANLTGDVTVERVLGDHYANRIILLVPDPGYDVLYTETFIAGTDGVTEGGVTTYTGTYPASQDIEDPWPNVFPGDHLSWWGGPPEFSTLDGTKEFVWDPMTSPVTLKHDDATYGVTTPGTELTVTYRIRYPVELIVNYAPDQADPNIGVWEAVVSVDGLVQGTEATVAAQILADRRQSGDLTVRYQTRTRAPLIRVGQQQAITAPARGISGNLLITEMTIRAETPCTEVFRADGLGLIRTITARRNQLLGEDWRETYRQWSEGGGASSAASSGAASATTGVVLTSDPSSPTENTYWVVRDGGSPESVLLKARINDTTVTVASS